MSLLNQLQVTMADLMPVKGKSVMVAGETTPYRVSERLYSAVQAMAVYKPYRRLQFSSNFGMKSKRPADLGKPGARVVPRSRPAPA